MDTAETSVAAHDPDPEREDWLEALESVLDHGGVDRANFLLTQLSSRMTQTGEQLPYAVTTPYRNTIPASREAPMPGDPPMERRIRALIRWNAAAMVVRANSDDAHLGGHISAFASSATLYDVGFNYFFRGAAEGHPGDLIYFQGHAAPGIYARSYLEGRISETDLDNFRREVDGSGLSSYPHPWLMPDYWQFSTVSMGLGPLQAIYQAHIMKYLDSRGLVPMAGRKVWAFVGDGECDEPETLGALSLAGREGLDNLIFVVNCNLQRLDGPVRGNGKIIQELEGTFRGAGWNVIKVVWGRHWEPLLANDRHGLLQKRMNEAVDGEYQNYAAHGGAYTREHFFGRYPELLELVSELSDDDILGLNRGGHDPFKVYAAYHEAVQHTGEPTVILAKTVKGYGLGDAGEAENDTHQIKSLDLNGLKQFRDRFDIPLSDRRIEQVPYYRPAPDSPELTYMKQKRAALGGPIPQRLRESESLPVPPLSAFANVLKGTGQRANSTTMAFVRLLTTLIRDPEIGTRVVPLVPDEARTFGMEGLFRQVGIYSSNGQLYEPEDGDEIAAYREKHNGQVLEEGINEAGAFAAWMAAATACSTHGFTLIPFYIFYSMFGFQRCGDLAWAAGDSCARGFLLGGTSGRTTLNGEGLQHQDGHSHLLSSTVPNCISYDPCYGYELAVIVHNGLERMVRDREPVFFYITLLNENYSHPPIPDGCAPDILKGMYKLRTLGRNQEKHVRLLGAGAILREVEAAAEILHRDYGVFSDVYSVTSYSELAREVQDVARWNLLHPEKCPRRSHVARLLSGTEPVIAASDYVKALAEQLGGALSAPYHVLGTDGFGRSDTRPQLRHHFEVDRHFIALAALKSLADTQRIPAREVSTARDRMGIDPDKPGPRAS